MYTTVMPSTRSLKEWPASFIRSQSTWVGTTDRRDTWLIKSSRLSTIPTTMACVRSRATGRKHGSEHDHAGTFQLAPEIEPDKVPLVMRTAVTMSTAARAGMGIRPISPPRNMAESKESNRMDEAHHARGAARLDADADACYGGCRGHTTEEGDYVAHALRYQLLVGVQLKLLSFCPPR